MFCLRILLLVCITHVCSFAQAQSNVSFTSLFHSDKLVDGNKNDLYFLCRESTETDVVFKGFYNPEWEKATLISMDNKKYHLKVRYQLKYQEIQVQFQNKVWILYPHAIKALKLKNKIFVPIEAEYGNGINYAYFELLSEGETNLYKLHDGNKNKLYYQEEVNQRAIPLKATRKNLLKLMWNRSAEVENYIKKQDLSYTNDRDLVKIFRFYNGN